MLAQPTPILAYAADGKVIDVATIMDGKKLSDEHANTIGLVTQGSNIWGIPYKADVKSTIWYPIKAFEAKGYTVPKTWDELIALSDKIVADGTNPWCVSAGGPGSATGWQITDWVEEVVLKTKGADYYNDWISHKIPFQDPGIKDAFDKYVGKIFFSPNYVFGGNTAIVATDQKTPMDPMFTDDLANPKCWMQKIPTWYGPDFFPDQRASGQPSKYIIGEDIGIFPFPTIDPAQTYAEGSADTLMVLADRPEVRAVAQFLATPSGLQKWIATGSAISTNTTTPADWYAGAYKLKVASEISNTAKGIGFDASDLMPAKVGSGTFWTETVQWANDGGTNTDAMLKAIDDSWPAQ
jgi:alpha-glucoside transport system substrate-binding protein